MFIDDILFFLATVCLIIGTVLIYIDDLHLYIQARILSGDQAPPADLAQQWIYNKRFQDTAVVLLSVTVMSVKFSFMFFFRNLLQRLTNLTRWWWFVLAVHIPTVIVIICAVFIVCPDFDERTMGEQRPRNFETYRGLLIHLSGTCDTPKALGRAHAVLVAGTVLDIVTDVLRKALTYHAYPIYNINLLRYSHIHPSPTPLACSHQPPHKVHPQRRSLSQCRHDYRNHHPHQPNQQE